MSQITVQCIEPGCPLPAINVNAQGEIAPGEAPLCKSHRSLIRVEGEDAGIDDSLQLKCDFCGKPITIVNDYRKVTGWERIKRTQGGTNALALREPTAIYAHWFCIDRARRHISPQQETLL